jgi:hypothetical protein
MENSRNNLMELGGSLGNIPQKLKILDIFWIVSLFLRVHFIPSVHPSYLK